MIPVNVKNALLALGYLPLTSVRMCRGLYSVAALKRGGIVELRVEAGKNEVGRITESGGRKAAGTRARIMHKQLMRIFGECAPTLEPSLYTLNEKETKGRY